MKHFWLMLFVAVLAARLAPAAQAAEPIKIGFSMELTGLFAVVGKTGRARREVAELER